MNTRIVVPALVAGLALALAAPASATRFCVPSFHAACPDNGTNVAQANLETAMQSNALDGIADTIVVDAGTRTDPASFEATGTDDLEIVGAGPGTTAGATRLTTSSNANIVVVNLFNRTGLVTMRDLTVAIPVTVPTNGGLGILAGGDTLENVDVESANHTHQQAVSFSNGGTYGGGAIYGVNGGGFLAGIGTSVGTGSLELGGLTVSHAATAIEANSDTTAVTLRRSRIAAPAQAGVAVSGGGSATVENSVITDPGFAGVAVTANSPAAASATVRHSTIARVSGLAAALPLVVEVNDVNGNGNAGAAVRSTIIRGFDDTFRRAAPTSGTIGNANLLFTYSNFVPTGATDMGDGAATLGAGNINADPLFAGSTDFHLLAGSPSIDAADPASPVSEDFDGSPRPRDGNGDSVARSDMGAFELQPPPPPPPTGTPPASAPTGERAAALKRCKKKAKKSRWSKKRLNKCRRKARQLPE